MIAIGRRVYSFGAIGLGLVELAYSAFSGDWLPVPPHIPGYHVLACVVAVVLILGGLAINLSRTALVGGLTLAAVFAGGMLILELSHAVLKPTDWGGWQAVAESTAMALGGVLACIQTGDVSETRSAAVTRIARWGFGVCLVIFGVSHFVYATLTASLVPAWLPPSPLVWAYLTGAAQIVAGLAMVSGVQARLAAILLTVMYAIFGVLVHIPSIIAHASSHDNWAENAINLILIGVAWTMTDTLSGVRHRVSGPTPA